MAPSVTQVSTLSNALVNTSSSQVGQASPSAQSVAGGLSSIATSLSASAAQPTVSQSQPPIPSSNAAQPTTYSYFTTSGPNPPSNATTTASLRPPTATPSFSGKSTSISIGSVVGIAIGCVVGGLIIGLIASCCFFRRRRPTAAADATQVTTHAEREAFTSEPKSVNSPDDSSGRAHGDIQLNHFLLEPTPDSEMAKELHSLGDLIHQHVETHYHLHPVNTDVYTLSQSLIRLGFPRHGHGISSETLANICMEPTTRITGLRHVISQAIFRSLDVRSQSKLSMLPAPLADFIQSIPQADARREDETAATLMAISKWRGLSAFLLHPNRSQRTPLPISTIATVQQAQILTQELNAFLPHFVQHDQGGLQVAHLQAVVMECAKLGYVVLSQPSDWRFTFGEHTATTRRENLVPVCVGLESVADRNGKPYRSPRTIVDPLMASISRQARFT